MNIHTYGADKRLEFCRLYLLRKNIRLVGDITLLPIPATRDGKTICGTSEPLLGLAEKMKPLDVLVGYDLPRDFRLLMSEHGIIVIDVFRDEEFLRENARLTAIGTLGRILTEENGAPCELSVGIIGFGRIGEELVRQLAFFGADITVFTSRSELCYELGMLGISGFCTSAYDEDALRGKLRDLDILINTAPANIISNEAISGITSLRIIELASGNNFPEGVAFERFSSVPAYMYPKSAGKALADSVLRMLGENESSKGMTL